MSQTTTQTAASGKALGEPTLSVRGLHRWLGEGAQRTHVLRGVSFDLEAGKVYSIVGPSGCGKSTLLYLLGLLDRPDDGEIRLRGERVDSATDRRRTLYRGERLGFVFQFHFLLSEFSARENIMLPMLKAGRWTRDEAAARADAILAEVGLAPRAHNRGNQLSGGEQQRVAVARALANDPDVILADEPTGNLDVQNSELLFGILQRFAHEQGKTILIVTHNMDLARRCDACLPMRDGNFVDQPPLFDA